jgi:hypothetical protein
LFAEISWSGSAQAGYGVGFDNTDAPEVLGLVRNRGENGLRLGAVASGKVATENYGTFTGTFGLRTGMDKFGGAEGAKALELTDDTRLTWALSTLPLTIALGQGGPGGTGTMGDYDTNLDAGGGWGIAAQLKPITGLTLAASAIYGPAQTTFDKITYAFGAKFSAADLLDVAANVNYNQTNADDKKKMNLAAGVSILPIVKAIGFSAMAFDVRTNNGLGANNSDIGVGARIGFGAAGLSLTLRARTLLWMGTDPNPGFMPLKANVEASYKASDLITIGIDGRYIIGNAPAFNYRNAGEMNDAGWNKDKAGIGISPYVNFNVGGPVIKLGYNLQNDQSVGASGRTLQHLVYGTIEVSF